MALRRLGLVPVASVLGVAAITVGVHVLGPEPRARTQSAELYDPTAALIEPTDRAILLGWIALTIGLALAFAFRSTATRRPRVRVRARQDSTAMVAGSAAMGVAIGSVTWTVDVTGMWGGITLAALFAGLVGAVLLVTITLVSRPLARAGTVLTAGLALAYLIPALVQIPSGIRDVFHYRFTSDEMVSVAVGRLPLADYVPQYTNLLGFPIAPFLRWFPEKSELLVLGWLLLLQLAAIAVAVALPVLVGGRRYLAPALIVAGAPPLMPYAPGVSGSAYFAVLPLRVVLPAAAILAAYLALRTRPEVVLRRPARFLLVGSVAGLAALNNPDFGLPVLITVLVVVFIAGSSPRSRFASTGLVAVGTLIVFVGYWLMSAIAGRLVDWSNWLAFQRTFGAEGLFSVAMEPFGPHIAVVGLFVSASVLGFVLIVRSRRGVSSFAFRQGLLLALTGGWATLTLPYFAGRSLVPVVVGGYGFAVGLVSAATLPLLHHSVRALRAGVARDTTSAAIGLAFGGLAVASAVATMAFVSAPSDYLSQQLDGASGRSGPLREATEAMNSLLADPANARLRGLVDEGVVAQSVDMSGLLQLTTGFTSASIASSPAYYATSSFFIEALCVAPWPEAADYLLVSSAVAGRIADEPSCAGTFDLGSSEGFSAGDATYVLFRHTS